MAAVHVETFDIPGLVAFTPRMFRDQRGFFSESYNARSFAEAGLDETFVQDNHSLSVDVGVVRGLHFQVPPNAQGKLVRVTRGAILDIAVDIRKGSPTYGRHLALELSANNWKQLWIPAGFAHGFCTIEPDTEVIYKVTDYYSVDADRGVAWDDPALAIKWPVEPEAAIMSAKDKRQPRLAELPDFFPYRA